MINQNHVILLSFGKMGDIGGESTILGDNPAGQSCWTMNLFK